MLRNGRTNLVIGGSFAETDGRRRTLFLLGVKSGRCAGRRDNTSGTMPSVTNHESAIKSLGASATIMVVAVLPAATRASHQRARAFCFWC